MASVSLYFFSFLQDQCLSGQRVRATVWPWEGTALLGVAGLPTRSSSSRCLGANPAFPGLGGRGFGSHFGIFTTGLRSAHLGRASPQAWVSWAAGGRANTGLTWGCMAPMGGHHPGDPWASPQTAPTTLPISALCLCCQVGLRMPSCRLPGIPSHLCVHAGNVCLALPCATPGLCSHRQPLQRGRWIKTPRGLDCGSWRAGVLPICFHSPSCPGS